MFASQIERVKAEREVAVLQRDRLSRMFADKDEFVDKLRQSRLSVHKVASFVFPVIYCLLACPSPSSCVCEQEKVAEFETKLKEERRKRLVERKQKRKEERRAKWLQEREEEEQRKKDEEAKRRQCHNNCSLFKS